MLLTSFHEDLFSIHYKKTEIMERSSSCPILSQVAEKKNENLLGFCLRIVGQEKYKKEIFWEEMKEEIFLEKIKMNEIYNKNLGICMVILIGYLELEIQILEYLNSPIDPRIQKISREIRDINKSRKEERRELALQNIYQEIQEKLKTLKIKGIHVCCRSDEFGDVRGFYREACFVNISVEDFYFSIKDSIKEMKSLSYYRKIIIKTIISLL